MNSLKAIAIPLILLATIGFALAMWYETLYVNVTVQTGEVKVEFSEWYCSDTGPDPQAEGFNNEEGKDVANCSVSVEVEEDGVVTKLAVSLDNAYPGYMVDIYLLIDNIGTIPVKLYDYILNFDEPIYAELIIPEDAQIDPGYSSTYILRITIPQDAEELSTYYGELTLTFAQWNEVP
ncbi:MAG: hypothetical protein QXE81_01700 [Desulfurococcaceae archaeon]